MGQHAEIPDQKQLTEAVKCSFIQDFKPLLSYFILFFFVFKVELIYNVVFLVYSKVIQLKFFFRLFSTKVYYKTLNIAPCSVLVLILFFLMFLRKVSEGKAERL